MHSPSDLVQRERWYSRHTSSCSQNESFPFNIIILLLVGCVSALVCLYQLIQNHYYHQSDREVSIWILVIDAYWNLGVFLFLLGYTPTHIRLRLRICIGSCTSIRIRIRIRVRILLDLASQMCNVRIKRSAEASKFY